MSYLMDGCKLLWHQDRLQDFLNGKRIMPITIDMGIHKSCNIHCAYCYGVKQGPSPKYIPADRLMMMAEDIKKADVRSIAIIGDGEPTLNLGLYPFVRELKRLGVDCSVGTNGLLLDNDKIDILTSSCTWVRFNISGVQKYEQIMGAKSGSFEKIEKIIKESVRNKKKCTIGLQVVLIPDGFTEIIPLARKALEWGVDYLVIKQFSDAGEGMPMHFDMDDYAKAEALLKEAEAMSTDRTKIIAKWKAMEDSRNITKYNKRDYDRCIDPPFLFQISGNGDCAPCGFLFNNPDYCYGNVCEQRLIDILNSERYWGVVKKLAETPVDKICKQQCRHTPGLRFLHNLGKVYKGDLREALVKMTGSEEQYRELLENPPEHINFF